MKRTASTLFLIYFLFSNLILFSQSLPGDEDNNGPDGLEGGDPPAAILNSKLWILIFLALVYGCNLIKKKDSIKLKN
jgi:hypothetical protein